MGLRTGGIRQGIGAVLVLALAALATGCGGSDDPDRPTTQGPTTESQQEPPTTEGEPTPAGREASRPLQLEQFRSPSGNIACVITERSARCDISERDWSPPAKPADCQLDYGQGAEVADGRARFVCAGDTTLNPQAPELPYGRESRVGDISCRSETKFMTCRNEDTGHGFVLSRERYRLF